ncbi:MAG: flagellar export chaperone FlgN [Deltaproteobacteria bacterium]|nr:flagellar export chaperone FlgN [Deltaproteobacteria bacterium]
MSKVTITENQIADLEQVLKQQLELYATYLTHLKADAELMAHLKIDELEKNNKAKTTLLLKIEAMDQARKNFVKQIARNLEIKEDQVTIAEICKNLSTTAAQKLLDLKAKLHTLIAELKMVQENTSNLANASLIWITGSMSTLKQLLTPTALYNPQGQVSQTGMFSGRNVERQA